jgi:hypothetical protein
MATEIDMIAGSELRDTQSEILDIAGADISELEAGRGYINDTHKNDMASVCGRVTGAKKIFSIEDCEDERHKYYWNKVKSPYIYVRAQLFDGHGDHRVAKAISAILRHQHAEDAPLKLKASVEGGILERGKDERHLKRTKIKGVAVCFAPANNATLVEGLNLQKSASTPEEQLLIKSLIPLARAHVPSFIETADLLSESKISVNIHRISELVKTLSAGYGGAGSPSNLTGGGVLQSESMAHKTDDSNISCPACSKNQHYLKYQTRCRHCSRAFPMDTLVKYFTR